MKAISPYSELNRLQIEKGDVIAIIDGRSELHFFKGQNQRTFDIGTFPRLFLCCFFVFEKIFYFVSIFIDKLLKYQNQKHLI